MKSHATTSLILALLTIPIVPGQNAKTPEKSKDKNGTIVFVCRYGSAKSVIAARFFNRIAAEEGLPLRAVARGIEPEAVIPPYVREPIRADRFEIGPDEKPVQLDAAETHTAVAVVCIGNSTIKCALPPGQLTEAQQLFEWSDVPDVSAGYAASRDKILAHMKELLVQLSPKAK